MDGGDSGEGKEGREGKKEGVGGKRHSGKERRVEEGIGDKGHGGRGVEAKGVGEMR